MIYLKCVRNRLALKYNPMNSKAKPINAINAGTFACDRFWATKIGAEDKPTIRSEAAGFETLRRFLDNQVISNPRIMS